MVTTQENYNIDNRHHQHLVDSNMDKNESDNLKQHQSLSCTHDKSNDNDTQTHRCNDGTGSPVSSGKSKTQQSSPSLLQRHTRTIIIPLISWFRSGISSDKKHTHKLPPPIKHTRRPSAATPLPQTSIQRQRSDEGNIVNIKRHWHDDNEHITDSERQSINELRNMRHIHEYVRDMSDKELMVFLLSRHMDVDKASVLIDRHYDMRREMKFLKQ